MWKLVQCMLIARTRMLQLKQSQQLQQQSSQRVGALSLTPSCLGISGHSSGSRQGHPRYTGARSAGRPWVARTQFSTADHSVRNTPSMVAEQCRSRARALAKRALLTRVCCVTEDPETKKSMRRSTRNSMRKRKWSMRSRSPWRMEQEAPRRVPWRQAKTRLKRAISVEKLGLWTWWQIGDQTVPVFTEARSVAQVWQHTYHLIQLVDEIVERQIITYSSFDGAEHKWWWNGCEKPSHKARLTELNMSDGTCSMCLMKFRRNSRNFDPTSVECCSSVDLSAQDTQVWCRARPETCLGGGTRCCARPVASVEEGREWWNVLCLQRRAGDARSEWRLVTHAADHSEETMRVRIR